ncbi:hypothetical protein PsorP6_007668 [Peronosclerospora sorghi]|uniref:Uncharacterized protein n=1 Tax=Peronosclerospora sorghi TaxID=230839 RepID=A0ACC0W9A7_9STRA|nr:hypothetical protein PsorP6_007668 [Peronosclerospora sorghi]
MLNYLRSTTGHLGISLPNSTSPHHLLSFVDDFTVILTDLRYIPDFLVAVKRYSLASGLTLNSDKTIILPFQACDPHFRTGSQIMAYGLNRPRPTSQPVWTAAAKRSRSCMFGYPILLQPHHDGLAWEVSGFRSSRIGGFSVTAIWILTF